MPIGDWQFWVVTIIGLFALCVLYRVLAPKKKGKPTKLTISAHKQSGKPAGKQGGDQSPGSDCAC